MSRLNVSMTAAVALAAALAASPTLAQKSKETLRMAITDPFPVLDSYTLGHAEATTFTRGIYQPLIAYDEHHGRWVPVLAKSWTRTGPTTIEFDLRDDVKFHNGNPFDADDVKYMFDWLGDPKVKIRFKGRYTWIKETTKLGPHKVRIETKKPYSTDLGALAYRMRIYDAETHRALADWKTYGLTAIGTGPYKVVSLDRNEGLLVERYEGYAGNTTHYRAPVKYVKGIPMPDRQTQVAQLITGGLDLMREITADQAKNLGARPDVEITPMASQFLMYVTLDAAGRSANKIMTDKRVRQAFIQAIDRNKLVKALVPGADIAVLPDTICFPSTIACKPTSKPYAYDPEAAKKLLAEAGYPNGVDFTLYAYQPIRYVAEAISGEIRKVGFRTSVEALPLANYVRKRGAGEFTAFVGSYPIATHPDASTMWNFFFGANRDYWDDKEIDAIIAKGDVEFDEAKRTAMYTPGLDKINREAYILPFSELPVLFAHHKDVKVMRNPLSTGVPFLGDYAFK